MNVWTVLLLSLLLSSSTLSSLSSLQVKSLNSILESLSDICSEGDRELDMDGSSSYEDPNRLIIGDLSADSFSESEDSISFRTISLFNIRLAISDSFKGGYFLM